MRVSEMGRDELRKLNSATQYPSIPTYHILGQRGRLTEERSVDLPEHVSVTEKIDGTNARIIVPPPGSNPLIGSRTELLHHLGDVIANPAQGIVDAALDTARRLARDAPRPDDAITVVYAEVYGGKASSGSKNYSTIGTTGLRVFDVALIPVEVMSWDPERIARWRDGGGQAFKHLADLARDAAAWRLEPVPRLEQAGPPPESVADTHRWLTETITTTKAALDDTGKLKPEGVVVRTHDRARIVKIRFEDYQRTTKARR